MSKKTNAARFLDGLGIAYELREYMVDESDLGAESVAEKISLPLGQVFKTLVVRGDKTGILFACVPGECELDSKKLAAVSKNKKVDLVPLKEVQPLTGYIRGGVSPIGAKKRYLVFLDQSAYTWPVISISAGLRGCQMLVSPRQLAEAIGASVQDIIRD